PPRHFPRSLPDALPICAVFVLLRCSSSDATRAFQHAIADDRNGALAGDHVAALGRNDALDDRTPGALGQLTTRTREASRSDGFADRKSTRLNSSHGSIS